jgi:exopolyphosphatase/guanosine-5'-triphosphate,3'-diphosphate pyrophosphatase
MTNTPPLGIIDMGTNTFHLLIAGAECRPFDIIHSEKVAVRIGKGGISSGEIVKDASVRAIQTLKSFKNTAMNFGVSKLLVFATSAMRNASNAKEIVQSINSATELQVQIINGDTEANYIYWGVKAALKLVSSNHLIMDIGGGSVEFIICGQKSILWQKSFEIGVQRLKDKYQQNDPITSDELHSLNIFFNSRLPILVDALNKYNPSVLIGCSGTFGTLSDIYEYRNNMAGSRSNSEGNFSLDAFPGIYEEFITKNYDERMKITGMSDLRADMIVVAVVLLHWVIDNSSFVDVRISHYAMKEGILYQHLNCGENEYI